jgi:hypothetical protein
MEVVIRPRVKYAKFIHGKTSQMKAYHYVVAMGHIHHCSYESVIQTNYELVGYQKN